MDQNSLPGDEIQFIKHCNCFSFNFALYIQSGKNRDSLIQSAHVIAFIFQIGMHANIQKPVHDQGLSFTSKVYISQVPGFAI
jgi:hypothetical protein